MMPPTSVHPLLATAPSAAVRPYEDIPALLGDDVTFVARFGYPLSHAPSRSAFRALMYVS